jgi:hypothetical protein
MADKTRLVMRQRLMTHSLAISSATACADLDIAQLRLLAHYLYMQVQMSSPPCIIALGAHVRVGSTASVPRRPGCDRFAFNKGRDLALPQITRRHKTGHRASASSPIFQERSSSCRRGDTADQT